MWSSAKKSFYPSHALLISGRDEKGCKRDVDLEKCSSVNVDRRQSTLTKQKNVFFNSVKMIFLSPKFWVLKVLFSLFLNVCSNVFLWYNWSWNMPIRWSKLLFNFQKIHFVFDDKQVITNAFFMIETQNFEK